jgi:hypothetical protein
MFDRADSMLMLTLEEMEAGGLCAVETKSMTVNDGPDNRIPLRFLEGSLQLSHGFRGHLLNFLIKPIHNTHVGFIGCAFKSSPHFHHSKMSLLLLHQVSNLQLMAAQ